MSYWRSRWNHRDDNGPSEGADQSKKPEWSRKQKRGYQRVRSLLWFWECHGFQVLWVMLSTAEGGNPDKLTYNHKRLRQRIEQQLGFAGIEYYQVRTDEGNGVLHVFWAWRPAAGDRPRRFWIDQGWLSAQWQEIHAAPVVWIRAYKPGRRSRNRLSRYVISQYVQDQQGYVNMSWSWKRSLGFPLGSMWESLRKSWQSQNVWREIRGQRALPRIILFRTWENLLSGEAILLNGYIVQLIVGKGLVVERV